MKRKQKNKIIALKPSELPCWRYTHPDGALAIYVHGKHNITVERALWILEQAKMALLDGRTPPNDGRSS